MTARKKSHPMRRTGIALMISSLFTSVPLMASTPIVDPGLGTSPVRNETIRNERQFVQNKGQAYYTTVNSGGFQVVRNQGQTFDTTVNSGGEQIVDWYGESYGTAINAGGVQNVQAGGISYGSVLTGGGPFAVQNVTGIAVDTVINSGAQWVNAGGLASGTRLYAGAQQEIAQSGVASDTIISGGLQIIRRGAAVTDTTINAGGRQNVTNGGIANNTIINAGGVQTVDSNANAKVATINAGGTQNISSGGIAEDTSINGGVQRVQGTAQRAIINTDGLQTIESSGRAESTIMNAGVQDVYGFASGTHLDGGVQNLYNNASYTTINAGVQEVYSGGYATGSRINSGGTQNVYAGGKATDTRIYPQGTQNLLAGSEATFTSITAGTQNVAGQAFDTDMVGGSVQNVAVGGLAERTEIYAGSTQNVYGRAIDTTVKEGGVQNIFSGSTSFVTTVEKGGILNAPDGAGGQAPANLVLQNTIRAGGILNATALNLMTGATTLTLERDVDDTLRTNLFGLGNLVKTGSGTLTLAEGSSNSVTWHGGVTVSAGTLSIFDTYSLGTGTNTLAGGALRLAGNPPIGYIQYNQDWVLDAGTNAIDTPAGVNAILRGNLSGTGGFTKTGDGILSLRGSNWDIGDITVSAGTLSLENDYYALGKGTNTLAGGTLLLSSSAGTYGKGWTLAGPGIINTIEIPESVRATMAGNLIGTGGFIKSGAGQLTLNGNNSYGGGTVVRSGILAGNIASNTSLVVAAGARYDTLNVPRSITTLYGAGSITNAGGLTVNSGVFTGDITGWGDLTKTPSGELHIGSAQAGDITIGSGIFRIDRETTATGTVRFAENSTFSTGTNSLLTAQHVIINSSNSTVDINSMGATLDPITIIRAENQINNSFTRTTVAGEETDIPTDINRFIAASVQAELSSDQRQIQVTLGNPHLVWYNESPLPSHGTFKVSTAFTLGAVLADREVYAPYEGWNGKTLTKTGAGILVLTGDNGYTGGTEIFAGTLSIGADNNIGQPGGIANKLGDPAGVDSATLQLTGNNTTYTSNWVLGGTRDRIFIDTPDGVTATMRGVLSGIDRGFTKTGDGTLDLIGNNTYAGDITVRDGLLKGTTAGLKGNITNNAAVEFTGSGTYSDDMSGWGSLTASGGELTFSGDNSYTGNTTVSSGTLIVTGDFGTSNNYAGNIFMDNAATLVLGQTNELIVSGSITGDGSLTKSGTQPLTLTGANSYTGNTTVSGGTLIISSDGNIGQGTNTLGGGTLQLTGTSYAKGWTFNDVAGNAIDIETDGFTMMSGVLAGAGGFQKTGDGTLILSGTNTYTGSTTVSAGTLSISSDQNLGPSGTNTLDSATLLLTGTNYSRGWTLNNGGADNIIETTANYTIMSGALSGDGGFTKTGGGVLALSGSNTYTGDTTVDSGVLSVAGTLGSGNYGGAIVIDEDAVLLFNQSANQALTGDISGEGHLIKTGSGALTLGGDNTGLEGSITIHGGTLSISSDNNLNDAASARHLRGGTLQLGDATYTKGWTLGYMPIVGINDIHVDGTVTMDGVLTGIGGFFKTGTGTLTLTGNNDYEGFTIVRRGVLAGNIAPGTDLIVHGGATYQSADQARTINSLSGAGSVVNTDGLTINRGLFTGAITGDGDLTKTSAHNLVIGSIGTSTSFGDIILDGGGLYITRNSFAQDLNANAGRFDLGPGQQLTAAGDVTFNPGSTFGIGFSGATNSLITTRGATIEDGTTVDLNSYNQTNPAAPFTVMRSVDDITGTFNRVTIGGSELHPEVTIDRFITADARVTNNTKTIDVTLGNFKLVWRNTERVTDTTDPDFGKTIAHGTFNVNSQFTLEESLSDNSTVTGNPDNNKWGWDGRSLTKTGVGTLELTGNNTYTGTTTVNAGTLIIRSDANIGTGEHILDGGALRLTGTSYAKGWTLASGTSTIETPQNVTFSGSLAGEGTLNKMGDGTLLLSGQNTYTGDTIINEGNLTITGSLGYSDTDTSNYPGNIINNTIDSVVFNQSGSQILSGSFAGRGGMEQSGTGELILLGNNDAYTGSITVSAGKLNIAHDSNLNAAEAPRSLSGGTLLLTGEDPYTKGWTLEASSSIETDIEATMDGVIAGDTGSNLRKTGEGELILAGNNTYAGNTIIDAGILTVTGYLGYVTDNEGVYAGTIINNTGASLIFDQDGNQTLSGSITGSGDLIKAGTGELTISGARGSNAYTGLTRVRAGTMTVGDSEGNWNISNRLALHSGAAFDATGVQMRAGNLRELDIYGRSSEETAAPQWTGELNMERQTMRFHMYGGQLEPVFSVVGDTKIKGANIELGMLSGYLFEKDRIELLKVADNSGTLSADEHYGMVIVERGTVMEEVYEIWSELSTNSLHAGLETRRGSERAKAYSEGVLSGLGFVNQGADLVAGEGMMKARRASGSSGGDSNAGFGAISGGKSRYKTGSHSDVSGVSLMAGFSAGRTLEQDRRLTVGGFIEYGSASYDTYNAFTRGSVNGDGDVRYYGAGALVHMDFANQFYAEGSFRGGRVQNKFAANGLGQYNNETGNYKVASTYLSAHLGAGYVLNLGEKNDLDLYGKYLWTHQGSDSAELSENESIKFRSVDSHRARTGLRFSHAWKNDMVLYAGAAYEYEFNSKAKAKATYVGPLIGSIENDINAPSLKGSTGIAEFGISFRPSQSAPLFIDVGVQGYFGKREGVAGNLKLVYEF